MGAQLAPLEFKVGRLEAGCWRSVVAGLACGQLCNLRKLVAVGIWGGEER